MQYCGCDTETVVSAHDTPADHTHPMVSVRRRPADACYGIPQSYLSGSLAGTAPTIALVKVSTVAPMNISPNPPSFSPVLGPAVACQFICTTVTATWLLILLRISPTQQVYTRLRHVLIELRTLYNHGNLTTIRHAAKQISKASGVLESFYPCKSTYIFD
jgi:hypothetical protein